MRIFLKNTAPRIFAFLLAVTLAAGFLPKSKAADATNVQIAGSGTFNVFVGETLMLSAIFTPLDGTYSKIAWNTTNNPGQEGSAQIIDAGDQETCRITGVTAGETTVTITVYFESGSSISDSRTVIVLERSMVTEISLNWVEKTMDIGESFPLVATVIPTDATTKGVNWTTSNSSVVTINHTSGTNITVTAVGGGTATITAIAADGSGTRSVCTVSVNVPPAEIILDNSASLVIGKTLSLASTTTVLPVDATNKTLQWQSSDTAIASVNFNTGLVTAKGVGTCIITATVANTSVTASCVLTVKISEYPTQSL